MHYVHALGRVLASAPLASVSSSARPRLFFSLLLFHQNIITILHISPETSTTAQPVGAHHILRLSELALAPQGRPHASILSASVQFAFLGSRLQLVALRR